MDNQQLNPYRQLVVGLDQLVPTIHNNLVTPINFDNAATTPPLKTVIQAINNFCPWYSSIHRGTGYKSKYSSSRYEQARNTIKSFVGANQDLDSLIFVKNTTEALNKLAFRTVCREEDAIILTSMMEHHSNDLPWRDHYGLDYINIDPLGRLDMADLAQKLNHYGNRVKLITVTGASNVTGHINPIHEIAKLAHEHGAKILVDGAQLVPHCHVDMKPHDSDEHIDFLVFSAHKMYAPFGTGVLIGPTHFFDIGCPDIKGGGTVKIVTKDLVLWDDPPHKDEAGTPNIIGVIALEAAIQTLNKIGMQELDELERDLARYAIERLKYIPGIKLYGDTIDIKNKVGIITFNLEGLHHEILASALSLEAGIAVRNGCFCAQPYVQQLMGISHEEMLTHIEKLDQPHPGMVRMSFGFYNSYTEIDDFLQTLYDISQHVDYYNEAYNDYLVRSYDRKITPLLDCE